MMGSNSDVDHVKRQLEELQRELDQEKSTTGAVIEQQETEIISCKKELETQIENEKKLKARSKELQEELDYTLRRIEQLQRGGTFTPVRRRTPGATNTTGSKNPSPYTRNTSGGKKLGVSPGAGSTGSAQRTGSNNPY
jgi:hypothetical protein